ncbi:hypothetical protein AVEN_176730-1 [Araneus ventricosus]|uniref:Uncharacterized protein n=1 Tax=Araneus ventricosus TaxID=182803 RepID=A0A4Y2SP36_ARAVE|nr:hypothetical protein AVEN_176730-1 [Araneus ventricosus]
MISHLSAVFDQKHICWECIRLNFTVCAPADQKRWYPYPSLESASTHFQFPCDAGFQHVLYSLWIELSGLGFKGSSKGCSQRVRKGVRQQSVQLKFVLASVSLCRGVLLLQRCPQNDGNRNLKSRETGDRGTVSGRGTAQLHACL